MDREEVVITAPIVEYMEGWPLARAKAYAKRRSWKMRRVL
jgi:hypothetical protein